MLQGGPLHGRSTATALLLACTLSLAGPVRAEPRLPPPDTPPNQTALDESLGEIEALVLEAHFATALGVAETTRSWADELPSSPEVREARARLNVLMSTAQIALGDEAAARESMERALAVWPLLVLDERTTSPRVVRLLRELQASRRAARKAS